MKKSKKYAENFIGKYIKIISSSDPNQIGIEGIVIYETKNTFHILKGEKIKIIPKKPNIFLINNQIIEGYKILFTPEMRLKKYLK